MKANKYRPFIVGVAAIIMAAMTALPFGVASIFNPLVASEFNTSMTAVALCASISSAAGMVFSLMLGSIVKKVPTKVLFFVGGIFNAFYMIALGITNAIGLIYVASFFHGVGVAISGTAMAQTVISRWFVKMRGTMMSLILTLIMLFSAVFNMILPGLIEANGYRSVALTMGIVIGIISIVLSLFAIVDAPETVGMEAYGAGEESSGNKKKKRSSVVNFTLKQALTTAPFWCILIYKFLTTAAVQAYSNQASSFYQTLGLSASQAGLVIALNALAGMVVCTVAGILNDKKGPTFTGVFTAGMGAIAFLLAFLWKGMGGAILAAIFFAGTMGCSLYGATMVTSLYGVKEAGGLIGVATAAGNMGSFVGPLLSASFYDRMGNYTMVFEMLGVTLVAVILMVLWAGSDKVAQKLKEKEKTTT